MAVSPISVEAKAMNTSSPWMQELDEPLISMSLRLWDEGLNTAEIAKRLFRHEAIVERALRLGRERRRQCD